MNDKEPAGTVEIKVDIDIDPAKELRTELEKAADAAERMADAMERVMSVFKAG